MKKYFILYLTLLFVGIFTIPLSATNYFLDATLGKDSQTGQSPLDPWKTLDKLNAQNLLPGDSILFKKGETWTGYLRIQHSGNTDHAIVFTAYGLGAKPLIQGAGQVQSAIFIANGVHFIQVNGLAVTNFDEADIFDGAESLRCGIQIGAWSGALSNIEILNNEVYYIEGCSNHPTVGAPRGSLLDPDQYNQYQNAAIFCHASLIDALTISGNYVHDCTCAGIFPFQFESATNLIVRQNSVYNVGSDGIIVLNAENPLIELNACIRAGNNSGSQARVDGELGYNGLAVAGIWSLGCSAPLFQYNYCEATKRITWDGQAWDFDQNTSGNAVYQYNFSRDNEGGFNLGGTPNQIFRYNISYNDGAKQGNVQHFFNGSPTYQNNVFYRTDAQGFLMPETESQAFLNNVFFTEADSNIRYQEYGRTFSNNCFFGHSPLLPGNHPVLADPMFVNLNAPGKILPGVIFSVEDLRDLVKGFQLNAGSACINAGLPSPMDGNVDFWENALLDSLPDIGVHEFESIPSASWEPAKNARIRVIPNPADMKFQVQFMDDRAGDAAVFRLYNSLGVLVLQSTLSSDQQYLDRGELPGGVYFFQITQGAALQGTGMLILH